MRSQIILVLLASLFTFGVSSCQTIPYDKAMSAMDGNAATVILCGLGEKCRKGMLFTQKRAGTLLKDEIRLVTGVLDCDLDSCVRFQLWRLDGSQGFSGAIPKGESEAKFTLAQVVGDEQEELLPIHNGEYLIKVKFIFKDADGNEMSTFGFGFIRVNVLNASYQAMGCDDPAVAWSVSPLEGCDVQHSTRYRTALCGECH